MSDIDLKREIGYKVADLNVEKNNLVVILETPTKDVSQQKHRFSNPDRMLETMQYIEDGEIKENPRWVVRLTNILEERLDAEEEYLDLDIPDEDYNISL